MSEVEIKYLKIMAIPLILAFLLKLAYAK